MVAPVEAGFRPLKDVPDQELDSLFDRADKLGYAGGFPFAVIVKEYGHRFTESKAEKTPESQIKTSEPKILIQGDFTSICPDFPKPA